MEDRFNFRIPVFTDKDTFIEFEYIELGDTIDVPLAGRIGEPQQCTGLKDKNGRLIFEGDIAKYIETDEIAEFETGKECKIEYLVNIHFDAHGVWFVIREDLNKPTSIRFYSRNFDEKSLEVIGNIYEDPKLLEANND